MNNITIAILAVCAILASGLAQAGNYPNSARTLTTGIGGGTRAASVPASHPYTSRSMGYARSGHNRNPAAAISIDKFGAAHAAAIPPSGPAYGEALTSFPGQGGEHRNPVAADKTAGKLPAFTSFPPTAGSNPGAGIPTSVPPVSAGAGLPTPVTPVTSGRPASISPGSAPSAVPPVSASIPVSVTPGTAPATIPPVSTGRPAVIPPALPAASGAMTQQAMDAAAAGLAKRANGRR